jgi:hypothetical protein
MLSRLFNSAPKWQSPKAQKRIEALTELQLADTNDREILLKLAREDSEPSVRCAAIKYLTDIDVITQIQKRDLEASVRTIAAQRLHDLLAGKYPNAITLIQRIERIALINTPELLVKLISEGDAIEIKLAALAQLNDEMYLDDIARHSTIARLRQAAAERIANPAILEALAETTRQSDKSVYKIIKNRLDETAQQGKEIKALKEKRETLCTAMEAHARTALNPLYAAKAENLRQQWQEQRGNEDFALSERFETAFATALKAISEIHTAAQRKADEIQAREEMRESVENLEATLREYQGQDEFDFPSLLALRKTQQLRWELAAQLQLPDAGIAKRYEKAVQGLNQLEQLLTQWQHDKAIVESTLASLATASAEEKNPLLQTLATTVTSYSHYDLALPALLQNIPALANHSVAEKKPARGKEHSNDKEAYKEKLQNLLQTLAGSIEAGNSREASKQLRKAREFAREHHLQNPRLAELGDRVHELQSWAGFVVQPKKEALIAEMEALVTHEMDPDDKADAIHAVQEQWKALGVADGSIEQPLWERFKAVSDKAFEPCRVHFSAQHELRQKNLEKRIALCEQLENYQAALPTDTEPAINWKNHEAILQTARKEWQHYSPADRQENQPIQERFHKILKTLEDLLHKIQRKHEAEKLDLITKATKLADANDLRSACDEAKKLQQQWKGIGQAHPKAERKLWDAFRAACDALFAKRDTDFKARQQVFENAAQEAETLIAAYQKLSEGDVKLLTSEAATLEENFKALILPREKSDALRKQFHAAQQHFEQTRRAQAQQARHEKQESRVKAWVDIASAPNADTDISLQTGKAATLLLDMEILLEIPATPALQAARRERQMQRLQSQGLKKQSTDHAKNMLAEFLQTGPIAADVLVDFTARLREVLQKQG